MKYKAFISYSHSSDGNRAPRLQHALHHIAKPWYRVRTMRVFRDDTNLSVSPALWSDIEVALRQSEFFLLMASPKSAKSEWVEREIEWWLRNRDSDTLLLIKSTGVITWDKRTNDFDWRVTTGLPCILSGAFEKQPLYVDLSWANKPTDLDLRNDQFRADVRKIAGRLLGKSPDEIGGEDVRVHRRNVRAAWTAAALVTLGAAGASWQAIVASRERDNARLQRDIAVHQRKLVTAQTLALRSSDLATEHDHTRATLLAALSLKDEPTQEAKTPR
jgi:hypothetical protein